MIILPYSNNHYVPQFILRRFGNKINRYNVETGEVKVKGSTINAFSQKDIYPEWLEKMLSKLESKMATLIDKKILNAEGVVTITREDNWLIKKFFTIATLRVPDSSLMTIKHLDSEESLKQRGFREVFVENETAEQYMYRTLKVILESNNMDELYNHPMVTYEACNWASIFYHCYLSIWDSTKSKEDFIITDNGMNCEHDKTRFLTFCFDGNKFVNQKDEMLKRGFVHKKMMESTDPMKKALYARLWLNMSFVHANYYLFAVSNTRTISLINPFFRLFDDPSCIKITNEVPTIAPSLLSREALKCNTQTYVELGEKNDADLFHYEVKDLSLDEVIIVNNMMLDRVYRWVGFDNSARITRSLNVYSLIQKEFQRKNYDKLIEYIYSLGYDFPKAQKYIDIKDRLTKYSFTEEEMVYVRYFYDLIQHK